MYIDKPVREYLDDLAAKRPAPGGGSAAALAAAVGTSLMSMVANFTVGNPKYRDVESKVSGILQKVERYDKELRKLIDEDVEAYERVASGLKSAGKDEAAVDELYKAAIEPPFLVCEITYNCLKLCMELAVCANKRLITDAAIAAIMLEGAFFAAKFNVYINLEHVKDMDYIGKIHKVIHPLEDAVPKLKEEILEACEEVIDRIRTGEGA
jgi:formiminotetrahydrofolate cyclodeaminase